MQSDILSLTDYIHAFQVVLQRLAQAHSAPGIGKACAEAARILQRVEAAHARQGVGGFEQAEFERISGQRLPSRVVFWLGDCSRRMAGGDFEALAEHVLHLCRGLEWMLLVPEKITVRTHLQITDLDSAATTARTGMAPPSGNFCGNPLPAGIRTRRH